MPMSPASPLTTFQLPPKTTVKLGKGVGKKAAAKQGASSKSFCESHVIKFEIRAILHMESGPVA